MAFQGTLGAGVSTRGGARGADDQSDTAYDVDLMPGLGLSLSEDRLTLSLGYGPLFNLRNVESPDRVTVILHNAYLSTGLTGSGFSLSLSQSVSIGSAAFRGLQTTPIDPKAPPSPTMSRVDLLPPNQVVKVFNESTSAAFTYRWDPRVSSALGASYSIGGGLGQTAQVALPQLRTASGNTSTTYVISGRDSVGANLGMSNIRTHGGTFRTDPTATATLTPDYTYWTLVASGTWTHRWSLLSSGSLTGGVYGYSSTPQGRTTLYTLAFTGAGFVDAQLGRFERVVVSAGLGAGVAPQVSPLSATIQQRVQGTGRISAVREQLSLTISGDGAQSFPIDDPQANRLLGLGASAGYAPARFLDLSLEYRSTWQSTNVAPGVRVWVAFLNVSVRSPPVRF
jgi:hypothetical protein